VSEGDVHVDVGHAEPATIWILPTPFNLDSLGRLPVLRLTYRHLSRPKVSDLDNIYERNHKSTIFPGAAASVDSADQEDRETMVPVWGITNTVIRKLSNLKAKLATDSVIL
jgi:hypothetical protein